jgi:hypothetical protein
MGEEVECGDNEAGHRASIGGVELLVQLSYEGVFLLHPDAQFLQFGNDCISVLTVLRHFVEEPIHLRVVLRFSA